MHGSEDRAKDASPIRCDDLSCERWVHTPVAHADDVPLLGALRTSAVIGAPVCSGGNRYTLTDRPRSSFRRRPAKSAAFQKTGMPFTATTREGVVSRRDRSLRPSRRLSRSRRPHFFPRLGTVLLIGHCKVTVRSPAGSVTAREYERLCNSLESRLGLTTQARQRARPARPSTRTGCPARTGADRSAQTASTTESSRPDVPRTS